MPRFPTIAMLLVCVSLPNALLGQTTDDLVFIHHSCGRNWLDNSLHAALLAKDYIDERNDIYYGTDATPDSGRPDSLAPYPGDSTYMDHWVEWFNDYLGAAKSHGCANGVNKIVMFKSCYPASNIISDGTGGDPFSSTNTLANYKAVYRHPDGSGHTYSNGGYVYQPLEDVFAANPDTLFIAVTAPPRHYAPSDGTDDAEGHRARLFNDWLKGEWLDSYKAANPTLHNVAVFDWFDVLAYADDHATRPNRLKAEYGGTSGDSHPNSTANGYSTAVYATNPVNFIDQAWKAFTNTPPEAFNDSYEATADTTLNVAEVDGVLANDVDADSDPLQAVLDGDVSHGDLSLASDGSFTYEPDPGYTGPDSFTYKAFDGIDYSAPATTTINVVAPTFTLTVNWGSGDGDYTEGQVVGIYADEAPTDKPAFRQWTGEVDGVADVYAEATTLTMPDAPQDVTATYRYRGDLNRDGVVSPGDLDLVLGNWGQPVPPGNPWADESGDNTVGPADLDYVLADWGKGYMGAYLGLPVAAPTEIYMTANSAGDTMGIRITIDGTTKTVIISVTGDRSLAEIVGDLNAESVQEVPDWHIASIAEDVGSGQFRLQLTGWTDGQITGFVVDPDADADGINNVEWGSGTSMPCTAVQASHFDYVWGLLPE